MTIFGIAVNNLKRRKVKMLFLMLGLVVGVATVVAFLSIIQAMNTELGDRIDEFGANAIILPRAEGSHGGTDGVPDIFFDVQKLTMEDLPKIYESSVAEFINIVSPKLVGAVQIGTQKSIIVGVEAKQEFTQKPWLVLQKQVGMAGGQGVGDLALLDIPKNALILGSSAARALSVSPGDQVRVNDRSFQVFGILTELGSEEDGLVYANLAVVQDLLDRPYELSLIEVSAYCNYCPIEEIAMGLEDALPNSRVIPLRQAALFREETIGQFSRFGLALSGMVLGLAALVILTTMLSSVNERTREIGIFRALGFRQGHIIRIILLEAGMVSTLGGLAGFILGSLVALLGGPFLAQFQGTVAIQPQLLFPSILLATILALLVSVYPALKAARLNPAEALRFI